MRPQGMILPVAATGPFHTPSDLVVNEGGTDVGSSSTLDFLLRPTLSRVSSPDETSNNCSNINGLKFYHSIRWNLVLCHRGQRAKVRAGHPCHHTRGLWDHRPGGSSAPGVAGQLDYQHLRRGV